MTDIQFTKDWWLRCISDNTKMTAWLQKLQRTEIGGYDDHVEYMSKNVIGERETRILTNIAEDERKHSGLLIDMFAERNIAVVPDGVQSSYWDEILSNVTNLQEYCAANYYGEALAAFRFEVIESMSETPGDIKEVIRKVIRKVLPDEIFHRETLQRLAGEETLARMQAIHQSAYNKLIGLK